MGAADVTSALAGEVLIAVVGIWSCVDRSLSRHQSSRQALV